MRLARSVGVAVAVVATALGASVTVGAPEASAAPNYKMPFPCNYTATAATWSGHSPANAVDFQKSGITGDPVVASAPGTVSRVANEGSTSYGRWIEINHGNGHRTRYAHLSSQQVGVGQNVSAGTKIGEAGATGGVTGPHLHYEQRYNGTARKVTLSGRSVPYYGKTTFTSKNCDGGGSNPYTPKEVCGSNYSVINSHGLGGKGRVYLLYNSGNGYNCVVTLKRTKVGTPSSTSAFLEPQGGSRATDSGQFSYYAGPVKKHAPGTCVKWGGSVGGQSYTSPFQHCG